MAKTNVIAVSVRQAKGKANRLCISATACLRSLSVFASAANSDNSRKDIRMSLLESESLATSSAVFELSTNLTIDLANSAADCEDRVADCPWYCNDTQLKSCASRANVWPDSILNCPRSAVNNLEAPPGSFCRRNTPRQSWVRGSTFWT